MLRKTFETNVFEYLKPMSEESMLTVMLISNLTHRVESLENWRMAFASRPARVLLDPATGLPVGANPADYSKGRIDMTTGFPIRDDKR